MRRRIALVLATLAALTLLPLSASAQEAAPPMPEDPRAPRFREVERGFFTGFEVGYLTLFKTRVADPVNHTYVGAADGGRSDGFVVGVTAGYDVTSRLALALYVFGSNSRASVNYGGFSIFSAGGDVRVSLIGVRDSNQVERLFVYLHGRAGYLITRPEGLFGNTDGYFAGGPGIEYFTKLRHFSIGLAADVAYLPKAKTAGIVVTPTVRYTF